MSHPVDIRMCHPADFAGYLAASDFGQCQFKGMMGPFANDFLQPYLKKFNKTCRLDRDYGLGQVDSRGEYTGCLGRLQQNLSDILFRPLDYPLPVVDGISQGILLLDTKVTFSQHVFHKNNVHTLQVLSSVQSVMHLAPFILIIFVIASLTLRVSAVLMKRNGRFVVKKAQSISNREKVIIPQQNITFQVSAHAFRFGRISCGRFIHARLVFISLSLFSIWFVNYFLSTIQTKLIVVDEPDVWHSYYDLIKSKVKPVFFKDMETVSYFEKAPIDSPEAVFWRYVTENFKADEIFFSPTIEMFMSIGLDMLARKVVIILDEIFAVSIRNTGCSFRERQAPTEGIPPTFDRKWVDKRLSEYFYPVLWDPKTETIEKTMVMSAHYSSKTWYTVSRRRIEYGIVFQAVEALKSFNLAEEFIANLPLRKDATPEDVRSCLTGENTKQHLEMENILLLESTITLFTSCAILIIISCIFLLFECIVTCINEKRSHEPPRRMRRRPHRVPFIMVS